MIASQVDHPALLYRAADEFVSGTTGIIRAARLAGEAVLRLGAAQPEAHPTPHRCALAAGGPLLVDQICGLVRPHTDLAGTTIRIPMTR